MKKKTGTFEIHIASINGEGVGVFTDDKRLAAYAKAFMADPNRPEDAVFESYSREVESSPTQDNFNKPLNPIYTAYPEPESDIIKPEPKGAVRAPQTVKEGAAPASPKGMEGVKVRRRN